MITHRNLISNAQSETTFPYTRPCASCVRKSYDCVDRACRACTRSGRETECTHRNIRDSGVLDPSSKAIYLNMSSRSSFLLCA